MSMPTIANIIGITGVIIILTSYFLLHCNKLAAKSYTYSIANLLGSSMILFSLCFAWNLSAALVEIAWIAISAFGIIKHLINDIKHI